MRSNDRLSQPALAQPREAPDCYRCRHFAISWQPQTPYACRLFGFSSRLLPALEVVRSDGRPCQGYERKPQTGGDGVSVQKT